MMPSETIFVNTLPVGRVLMNTNSQEISFHFWPTEESSKVPKRNWQSITQLRRAVIAAYINAPEDQSNES
jgi:hypothetical protein